MNVLSDGFFVLGPGIFVLKVFLGKLVFLVKLFVGGFLRCGRNDTLVLWVLSSYYMPLYCYRGVFRGCWVSEGQIRAY
ncbi:MAG: hypothetical protein CO098_14165 [Bacteroidetes bacterium CG_4_9_14_3_um_filter_41_19]|nr:MAG: hypothetical protein CO098_14165 [Bacteroidetes bacterium CG_4_9_14_3_um_filter_41_19]